MQAARKAARATGCLQCLTLLAFARSVSMRSLAKVPAQYAAVGQKIKPAHAASHRKLVYLDQWPKGWAYTCSQNIWNILSFAPPNLALAPSTVRVSVTSPCKEALMIHTGLDDERRRVANVPFGIHVLRGCLFGLMAEV